MYSDYIKYVEQRNSETETEFVTELDFPGATKEGVTASAEDGTLVLHVVVRGKTWVLKLNYDWDQDFTGTKVKVENGVVTVRVPKNIPAKKEVKILVE